MNIFLGAYGNGGTVQLECDYIRFYQWHLDGNNELPNGSFEYDGALFPWEGEGAITRESRKSGQYALKIDPGKTVYQYVYLDPDVSFECNFYGKGESQLFAKIENITQVSGKAEDEKNIEVKLENNFTNHEIFFQTGKEEKNHMRTVKLSFTNRGQNAVIMDDIEIKKYSNPW